MQPPSLRAFNNIFSPVDVNPGLPDNLASLRNVIPYKWKREHIFAFLSDITTNPTHYDVPSANLELLVNVLHSLQRISLPTISTRLMIQTGIRGAEDFRPISERQSRRAQIDERLAPDQHIRRQPSPFWQEYNQNLHPDGYPQESKFTPQPYEFLDTAFVTPYDLLGLFLSFIGPAPLNATVQNFYLPITYLYGQWCSKIASRNAEPTRGNFKGVGPPPAMYQCTWITFETSKRHPEFFLGASLSGYSTKSAVDNDEGVAAKRAVGTLWERRVQESRYHLVPRTVVEPEYLNFDSSVMREKDDQGTRFGNCAETYPFLYLFGQRVQELLGQSQQYSHDFHVSGMAMRNRIPSIFNMEKVYKGGLIFGPCENCRFWIRKYFGPDSDKSFDHF